MKTPVALALGLVLGCANVAFAQQFKWTDPDGGVRYGNVAPPGVKATRLAPPPSGPGPAPAAGVAPATPADAEIEYRKRQREAQAKAEKQALEAKDAEAKAGNCQRAQEAVRVFESGQRIARVDAKGERYFPDAAAIADERAKAEQIARENCN